MRSERLAGRRSVHYHRKEPRAEKSRLQRRIVSKYQQQVPACRCVATGGIACVGREYFKLTQGAVGLKPGAFSLYVLDFLI